mgnify:CR=1 FL=1
MIKHLLWLLGLIEVSFVGLDQRFLLCTQLDNFRNRSILREVFLGKFVDAELGFRWCREHILVDRAWVEGELAHVVFDWRVVQFEELAEAVGR